MLELILSHLYWRKGANKSVVLCVLSFVAIVDTQKLPSYNLWVCPHCEKGNVVADVTDLSCESEAERQSGPFNWPEIKRYMYRFLESFALEPEQRDMEFVNHLLDLSQNSFTGKCYLGILAMGLFTMHFMESDERWNLIRTTIFGGVTFQRACPLSYWDVYSSGWPIFGLLAAASSTIREDVDLGGHYVRLDGESELVGLTGIDLRPRNCCDFLISNDDKHFLLRLSEDVGGNKWLKTDKAIPLKVSLDYLARTSHIKCSSGRAAAYFAITEHLLSTRNMSSRLWNSTQALMALGEQNLESCGTNLTIYHHWHSLWPFWQVLGRVEQRRLDLSSMVPSVSMYMAPFAMPSAVKLKWEHFSRSRGYGASAYQPTHELKDVPAIAAPDVCISGKHGFAHVAFSADLAQIDGLIVALQSSSKNAGRNASRLCFHVFVLPNQREFVAEALICAFNSSILPLRKHEDAAREILSFMLYNQSRLLIHSLDEGRVREVAGLHEGTNTTKRTATSSEGAVFVGETDIRGALRSDTGNLEAIHNFVRFLLHEFLPVLSRVVYLDVDIVVKGDLCELYDTPLLTDNGATGTVAAVQRSNQALRVYVNVLQPIMPKWLPSEAPSFNAGVMVIDLARWRERNASHYIAEWVALKSKERSIWLGQSQPPLLLLFHDEVAPLHWSWNVDGLGHRLNYPKEVLREAKVLHWTGPLKPWKHHGVNRFLWEPFTLEYCPPYSFREHTTTCRPDSWHC